MTDKDVPHLAAPDLEACQLQLGAFPAVYHKHLLIGDNNLGSRMPFSSGYGGIIA